ncbi:hypothetical protein C8R43DRAFT_877166 [Mycena crocata]|nr:hypothetical protein C8R43DRAFT_877166 [Mycena crocata]
MNGLHSEAFHSDIGVLIGDPVSSTFWDLFFADFKLHPDPDDVMLLQTVMSHLEHADDMAIVSYTPEGLQWHLDTFARWCGNNLLQANASKSWIMVFGPLPKILTPFYINGQLIGYTDCFCYVGLTFQSTHHNIFASHYTAKASTARRTVYSVLGIEVYIGDLPPKEGRLLYMACIDPHLTSGADVIVDVDSESLMHLEKVQKAFLRHLLGLGAYSMCTPLYTELGLLPLRYRRLILALRYLGYLVGLAPTHYARIALKDSYNLFVDGYSGYWMDLVYALQHLHDPITLPALSELTSEACHAIGKAIYTSAMKALEADVSASTRLYMLHDRFEPLEDEPPKKIILLLRHYLLLVVNARHRKALTRLLVSQHLLAVERMRYNRRGQKVQVPWDERVCRFGCNVPETVEHAMFFCTQSLDLLDTRKAFIQVILPCEPKIQSIAPWNATSILKSIIFRRDTVCRVVKYAHKVFAIYNTVLMTWPDGYL